MIFENALTTRILLFLEENPNTSTRDIYEAVGEGVSIQDVSHTLQYLKRKGAVENTSHRFLDRIASWQLTDVSVEDDYFYFAQHLLEELKSVHHSARVVHLANLLREKYGSI